MLMLSILSTLALLATAAAPVSPGKPAEPATPDLVLTSFALPGAPQQGVALDYLAADLVRHRIWVPAGGTGSIDVIDTKTGEIHRVLDFPTAEVERRGQKRLIGPSSATVGDGVVYVGDRADSSVCAVDATTLVRAGCVKVPSMPDGLAFVARTHEVWVTTPRTQTIVVLDVSKPAAPKLSGSFTLEGAPEGYAVDDGRGLFYTNLEDKDKTLRIDVATRKVTAVWSPECGEDGPKGLALEPAQQLLMVACSNRVEVLDAGKDGRLLSKLDTGEGVDNLDYLPARRALYVAAAGAATITIARLDATGVLSRTGGIATAKGARNAVVDTDGSAYIADGPGGKILLVRPAKSH